MKAEFRLANCDLARVFAAAALLCLAAPINAVAQQPDSNFATFVCVAKTDSTGGRMRFVVIESDAALFEKAGFERFACPILTPEIAQGQKNRCDRLRSQSVEAQGDLEELYGLSVAQMCAATDAWAQMPAGG